MKKQKDNKTTKVNIEETSKQEKVSNESFNDNLVTEKEINESKNENNNEYKEKYLRLYAEYENYRKRTNKERVEIISTANKELIFNILFVLDDMERALSDLAKNNNIESQDGLSLIYNKLKNTLDKEGVNELKISKGDDFDPDKCEAITKIPTTNELKEKIVDIIQKGYTLNDKIIRFAKVIIGQ